MKVQARFLAGAGIILASVGWLAWTGAQETKTYYHTIAELADMRGASPNHRMRVGGDVAAGSIHRLAGRVDFVLQGEGKTLQVSYVGTDPLPDTFVDGAQALVEGKRMPDGRFVAEKVQAKCASKYEPAPGQGKPAGGGSGPPEKKS